jgi:hypothetical protein
VGEVHLSAKAKDDLSGALEKHFPYSIFFVDRGDKLEVICIFHQSRDPALWQERLTGPGDVKTPNVAPAATPTT